MPLSERSKTSTVNRQEMNGSHPAEKELVISELYRPLDDRDATWLTELEVDSHPSTYQALNALIEADIPDMHVDYDPAIRQHIIANRRAGLEVLGLPADRMVQETCQPLHSVVATLRTYHHYQLPLKKLTMAHPAAINYNPESVKAKRDNFESLGLDGVKLVTAQPAAIGYSPESVKMKLENFEALGLDGVKLVTALPAAMNLSPESVRAKFQNFEDLGVDGVKLVTALPAALAYSPESVKAKLNNFEALGLNGVKLVTAHPAAIGYSPDKIRITAYTMMKLGVWEGEDGVAAQINRGQQTNIFMTPIESLLLLAASGKPIDLSKNVAGIARRMMEHRGARTSRERQALMMELLQDQQIKQKLGHVATCYIVKQKLGWDSLSPDTGQ